MRSLFGEPLDGANRPPVAAAVVVARAMAARVEVEAHRVVVAQVRDGRPVVAVRTGKVELNPIAVAGGGEEDAIRNVRAPAAHDIALHAVLRRPRPIALVGAKVVQFLVRRHPPAAAPMDVRSVMRRSEDNIRAVVVYNPAFALERGDGLVVCWTVRRSKNETEHITRL